MSIYRVLVVDDSSFMRKIFTDLIQSDDKFEVVATAKDGKDAIVATLKHRPDVITMDVEMPVMNGLEAVDEIMKIAPTPIIMLSSTSDDGAMMTIKALHRGAFDFISKPSGPMSPDIEQVGENLREKLNLAASLKQPKDPLPRLVEEQVPEYKEEPKVTKKSSKKAPQAKKIKQSKIEPDQHPEISVDKKEETPEFIVPPADTNVKKAPAQQSKVNKQEKPNPVFTAPASVAPLEKPVAKLEPVKKAVKSTVPPVVKQVVIKEVPQDQKELQTKLHFQHIIAIGTSTGGPRALYEVITSLPAGFPAPVLVVQHMPPKFTHSLAQRLNSFSKIKVVEATQGERVLAGVAYIAPGGHHMEITKDGQGYAIQLTNQPLRNGHRPSVDVLFESCSKLHELSKHAVLMTGMGSDGAKGMKLLLDKGAKTTIAEAEETCVVYGMPRSAVELGVAQKVLPLPQIAKAIVDAIAR